MSDEGAGTEVDTIPLKPVIMQLLGGDHSALPCRLQILEIKTLVSNRTRVVLSDGVHYAQGLLNAALTREWVVSEKAGAMCIIEVSDFIVNTITGIKMLIIARMRLLERHPNRLGDPKEAPLYVPETLSASPSNKSVERQGGGGEGKGGGGGGGTPSRSNGMQVSGSFGRGTALRPTSLPTSKFSNLPPEFFPISSLTPYNKSWVIKARVTNRSGIKGFAQRQRGTESKLASVDLLDESGGEIRATMYGAAVDRFYPVMTEGRVVIVRHANLKIANKRFSSLVHDYEITLNTWSEVIPCDGAADDGKIEQQRYNFVAIADCERLDAKEHADRSFDVIGCVRQVGAPLPFIAKMSGKPMIKRIIVITDRSGRSTDVVFWGDLATKYGGNTKDEMPAEIVLHPGTIVAIKACKIADYAPLGSTDRPSRSLNTTFGSVVIVNPRVLETRELEKWWTDGGRLSDIDNITRRFGSAASGGPPKPIASIVADRLGFGEGKGDYITVRGTITLFSHDPTRPPWYDSCPHLHSDQKDQRGQPRYCMKKAIKDETGGGYLDCQGCRQRIKEPVARYTLSMLITDSTASTWISSFGDQAIELLGGTKANELKQLLDTGNITEYEAVFTKHNFKTYVFRLHAKLDDYQSREGGEPRVWCRLMSATPIKYDVEILNLVNEIKLLDLP